MASREPKDPRSTNRKRARAVLERIGRPFECECDNPECPKGHGMEKCGWKPDPSIPIGRSNNLDANHKNKILADLDPANLEWLCRTCHRFEDRATAKGVMKDEHKEKLYGDGFFI